MTSAVSILNSDLLLPHCSVLDLFPHSRVLASHCVWFSSTAIFAAKHVGWDSHHVFALCLIPFVCPVWWLDISLYLERLFSLEHVDVGRVFP
jgi:hypothetical protein